MTTRKNTSRKTLLALGLVLGVLGLSLADWRVGVSTATTSPAAPSTLSTSVVDLPVTWGRSNEANSLIVQGSNYMATEAQVAQALALPIDPNQPVWDQGTWAYWVNGPQQACDSTTASLRRFHSTINLTAAQAANAIAIAIYDASWPGPELLLPINDRVSLFLNGSFMGRHSSAGCADVGPVGHCTQGTFNGIAGTLHAGANDLDLIAEENCAWGGMSQVSVKLIVDVPATVVIAGCNSGVPNHVFATGASFNDLIGECAASASNHGQFVSCVSALTNNWKSAGLITGAQKGAIMSCAGGAPIP